MWGIRVSDDIGIAHCFTSYYTTLYARADETDQPPLRDFVANLLVSPLTMEDRTTLKGDITKEELAKALTQLQVGVLQGFKAWDVIGSSKPGDVTSLVLIVWTLEEWNDKLPLSEFEYVICSSRLLMTILLYGLQNTQVLRLFGFHHCYVMELLELVGKRQEGKKRNLAKERRSAFPMPQSYERLKQ
ncbi:hypothetical protein NDU88_002449 [Pleurodeles waltl]|uniref:Uncharacterized protein n=1 Tax=Pleurodeles waltl TaxID=8319 RepID=A0AAV7T3A0_PLEWA|nr:hypothetical protein NDU88_002449 [Pleurodeles waltl]